MRGKFFFGSLLIFVFLSLVSGIIIDSPENGGNYTGNVSLNYSVSGIGECWYNLNDGSNVSLFSCGNTTLSLDYGNYSINLYFNDSFGNLSYSSSSFSVSSENVGVLEWFKGNKSSFDLGNYSGTNFSSGSLSLLGNNSGYYLSEVFDSGNASSLWNNLTYFADRPYGQNLKSNDSLESVQGGFDMSDNILLYHFDDLSGADYSGNGNGALVFGDPILKEGRFGSSVVMNGNDYFEAEHSNSLNIKGALFSISVWVKTESDGQIVYKEGYAGNDYYGLKIENGHAVFEFSSGSPDSTAEAISSSNILDGEWHHLLAVRDSSKRGLIYVDGVLEDSDSYTGSLGSADTDDVFLVGSRMGSNLYSGELDELAIFTRALDSSAASNLFERGAVDLDLYVRGCDNFDCSTDWVNISEEFNISSRYFQYRFNISSLETGLGEIFNITVRYLYGLQEDSDSEDSGSGDSGGGSSGGGSSGGGGSGSSGGSGGGGSGGSGSSGTVVRSSTSVVRVGFEDVGDRVFKRGETSELRLEVQNQEIKFLNKCSLKGSGLIESWISDSEVKGLSAGEKFEYVLDIKVPDVLDPGVYRADFTLECDEGVAKHSGEFSVYRNRLEITIDDYERFGNNLRVNYSITDHLGAEQDLEISYLLLDFDNITRTQGVEEISLGAGSGEQFLLEFDLPKDSFGEFSLILSARNSIVSGEVRKGVFLPSVGITGLFISDLSGSDFSLAGLVIFVVIFAVFLIWLLYKISVKIRRRKGNLQRYHGSGSKTKRVRIQGR